METFLVLVGARKALQDALVLPEVLRGVEETLRVVEIVEVGRLDLLEVPFSLRRVSGLRALQRWVDHRHRVLRRAKRRRHLPSWRLSFTLSGPSPRKNCIANLETFGGD